MFSITKFHFYIVFTFVTFTSQLCKNDGCAAKLETAVSRNRLGPLSVNICSSSPRKYYPSVKQMILIPSSWRALRASKVSHWSCRSKSNIVSMITFHTRLFGDGSGWAVTPMNLCAAMPSVCVLTKPRSFETRSRCAKKNMPLTDSTSLYSEFIKFNEQTTFINCYGYINKQHFGNAINEF